MKLPREWRALIVSLLSHRVRFLIVGAHALAAHGRPRATQALDIFVEPTVANARRLGAALDDFGYPALAREWQRLAERDRMATLGRVPLRIDIMTSISGVGFGEAWKGRKRAKLGGRTIGFIGREELIRNKRSSGRTKDLLDLELLDEIRAPTRRKPRSR
jgi:hypothetical protein